MIRRGMSGNGVACLLRMRLGMDYVRLGARMPPEAILAQFNAIPEAVEALKPVADRFEAFWTDVQASFVKMVEAEEKNRP